MVNKVYRECAIENVMFFLKENLPSCSPLVVDVIRRYFSNENVFYCSRLKAMPKFASLLRLPPNTQKSNRTSTVPRSEKAIGPHTRHHARIVNVDEIQWISNYSTEQNEKRSERWRLMVEQQRFPISEQIDKYAAQAVLSSVSEAVASNVLPFTTTAVHFQVAIELAQKLVLNQPIPVPVVQRFPEIKKAMDLKKMGRVSIIIPIGTYYLHPVYKYTIKADLRTNER
jgi:hypothetical protein